MDCSGFIVNRSKREKHVVEISNSPAYNRGPKRSTFSSGNKEIWAVSRYFRSSTVNADMELGDGIE